MDELLRAFPHPSRHPRQPLNVLNAISDTPRAVTFIASYQRASRLYSLPL